MKTKKVQKPFDIKEWENGAKVEIRDGRSVRIICTDALANGSSIVGLAKSVDSVGELVMTWYASGRYLCFNEDDERDLVIVEEVEEPERWADDKDAFGDGYYVNHHYSRVYKLHEIELNRKTNYCFFATERQAKSALAMARISQLMAHDERYGGVVTDEEWKKPGVDKYCLIRRENTIKNEWFNMSYCFLAFHTPEQGKLFLAENEQLVKDYLMID